LYQKGTGVPQDYSEAAKWFRKAAERGDVIAQNSLGMQYSLGFGVPQDYVQAHMWFNIAASLGDAQAAETRDRVATLMTSADIRRAQELARECAAQDYRGC